ncbi:hypothetical protein [Demequina oxidasica]|uniref:hypothetical protein n=1 Tax=Demequina oxidasica TaxID=676199 RepID=UPI001364B414|nr:hypothetical protein [Demequina oxidasica]
MHTPTQPVRAAVRMSEAASASDGRALGHSLVIGSTSYGVVGIDVADTGLFW